MVPEIGGLYPPSLGALLVLLVAVADLLPSVQTAPVGGVYLPGSSVLSLMSISLVLVCVHVCLCVGRMSEAPYECECEIVCLCVWGKGGNDFNVILICTALWKTFTSEKRFINK